jgi:putative transcriptional regulator
VKKSINRQIGDKVKTARVALELSQGQLADLAGLDRKTVNRIENEHFSPSVDTLFRLCTVFGIHPTQLLQGVK